MCTCWSNGRKSKPKASSHRVDNLLGNFVPIRQKSSCARHKMSRAASNVCPVVVCGVFFDLTICDSLQAALVILYSHRSDAPSLAVRSCCPVFTRKTYRGVASLQISIRSSGGSLENNVNSLRCVIVMVLEVLTSGCGKTRDCWKIAVDRIVVGCRDFAEPKTSGEI